MPSYEIVRIANRKYWQIPRRMHFSFLKHHFASGESRKKLSFSSSVLCSISAVSFHARDDENNVVLVTRIEEPLVAGDQGQKREKSKIETKKRKGSPMQVTLSLSGRKSS